MKARIELPKHYDEKILRKCVELYEVVFAPEYHFEFAHFEEIHKKNPRIKVLCWLGDELAGYVHYYPLTPAAYDRFLASDKTPFDLGITGDDIAEYDKNIAQDMFIALIVLDPKFQGKMLALVLMRGVMLAFKELKAEGYKFGRLGSTAASDAGMHQLCTYLGLKQIHTLPHGIRPLAGDCETAVNTVEEYMGFEGLEIQMGGIE